MTLVAIAAGVVLGILVTLLAGCLIEAADTRAAVRECERQQQRLDQRDRERRQRYGSRLPFAQRPAELSVDHLSPDCLTDEQLVARINRIHREDHA